MKAKSTLLLLHPAFLSCLLLLFVNDFYWKYEYHNWITGKLSDITGLFVFTVFLTALFPGYKKTIVVSIVLFFCWWKSPFSNGFIQVLNEGLSLPVQRVADYTDLFALLIIPAALLLKPIVYPDFFFRRIAVYTSGFLAFTSFCSTSMVVRESQREEISLDKTIGVGLSQTEIERKFKEKNIPIQHDTADYVWIPGNNKYFKIKDSTGAYQMIRVSDYKGLELYERNVYGVPSYTIPELIVNKDTLKRVHFLVSNIRDKPGRERSRIMLQSFVYGKMPQAGYPLSQLTLRHKYERPIKKRIKEILD